MLPAELEKCHATSTHLLLSSRVFSHLVVIYSCFLKAHVPCCQLVPASAILPKPRHQLPTKHQPFTILDMQRTPCLQIHSAFFEGLKKNLPHKCLSDSQILLNCHYLSPPQASPEDKTRKGGFVPVVLPFCSCVHMHSYHFSM